MTVVNLPRRVLLIEDDREMASSLATLLLVAGYEVEMAFNGESALETAESFCPDVCLVDLNVPGLNIYGLSCFLQEQLDTLPVVANITPFIDRDDWDADTEFDLDFSKPTDPFEVVDGLTAFLRNGMPKVGTACAKSKPRKPDSRRHPLARRLA